MTKKKKREREIRNVKKILETLITDNPSQKLIHSKPYANQNSLDQALRRKNNNQRKRMKKADREQSRREMSQMLNEKYASEHACIRRDKKSFNKKDIIKYITNSDKQLGMYYCKKCNAYHLTSSF
jgi:hypothetical protein